MEAQSDVLILSDNEQEKNSGRPFTDIWKYIKRGRSRGNGHYEGICSICSKKWGRGKPTVLRAHIANHCTSTTVPANVKSYFIKIVTNENERKREYSSDNEAENTLKKQKTKATNINDHYQKKEKLNSNRIEEIDCGLVRAFICCGIPFWIIE